jgi:FAD binding domain of DNA photolyase
MLRAWQRGRTGFPLVDAGMRQLWATGWMQQVGCPRCISPCTCCVRRCILSQHCSESIAQLHRDVPLTCNITVIVATQSLRMVTACFLTEYLNISWVEGARWYHDTLVRILTRTNQDVEPALRSMACV